MTTYYCGLGGNDGNTGLSWAQRKATLNGCEDVPITAGSTVYVAPGVYREMLTADVAGTAGNPITYIGDVTGEHTDGVGGIVRITGSDDDLSATRANCIVQNTPRTYRTWRGFYFDTTTGYEFTATSGLTYNIIEDCIFMPCGSHCIGLQGSATLNNNTIRRCIIIPHRSYIGLYINYSAAQIDNSANLIENCLFIGGTSQVNIGRVGGTTVKNCTFQSQSAITGSGAVFSNTTLTGGQTITVNNCIFQNCGTALGAQNTADITENYNTLYGNNTDRTNTNTGANSVTTPALLAPPLQLSGLTFPWQIGVLSNWSQVKAIAGSGTATDDIFGMARPATAAKISWGAFQYNDVSRSATQAHAGTYALKMADAGRTQFQIPTTNVSTVFSVWVYFEADYTGTKPQMVIKQPGVADTTVVATGAVTTWEELTTTLTPAASPGYVIMELVSNNTAAATNFATYFDDITVT